MCNHGYGESLDGCKLVADPVSGRWRCWANQPLHVPRHRTATEDRLAKLRQGDSQWVPHAPTPARRRDAQE